MFIVKLAEDFYIANMGPTSFKERAKQYKTSKGAKIALASYRTRKPHADARIINLDVKLGLVT